MDNDPRQEDDSQHEQRGDGVVKHRPLPRRGHGLDEAKHPESRKWSKQRKGDRERRIERECNAVHKSGDVFNVLRLEKERMPVSSRVAMGKYSRAHCPLSGRGCALDEARHHAACRESGAERDGGERGNG